MTQRQRERSRRGQRCREKSDVSDMETERKQEEERLREKRYKDRMDRDRKSQKDREIATEIRELRELREHCYVSVSECVCVRVRVWVCLYGCGCACVGQRERERELPTESTTGFHLKQRHFAIWIIKYWLLHQMVQSTETQNFQTDYEAQSNMLSFF